MTGAVLRNPLLVAASAQHAKDNIRIAPVVDLSSLAKLVQGAAIDATASNGLAGICPVIDRVDGVEEVRYSHAGVQHLNKISRSNALASRELHHFGDGAFYELWIGFRGWAASSNIVHGSLLHRPRRFTNYLNVQYRALG
jgi:hypothetical protein